MGLFSKPSSERLSLNATVASTKAAKAATKGQKLTGRTGRPIGQIKPRTKFYEGGRN